MLFVTFSPVLLIGVKPNITNEDCGGYLSEVVYHLAFLYYVALLWSLRGFCHFNGYKFYYRQHDQKLGEFLAGLDLNNSKKRPVIM